jgi:hypothetical protein
MEAKPQEECNVKFMLKLAIAPLLALAAVNLPLSSAVAQALKPVAVVSIASIKENLADVDYITRAAGMADYGNTARFFAGAMTSGIDKDRPIGMYFVPQNDEFHAVAFMPLEPNGLATIFKIHKEKLGEPKDLGDGVWEAGTNKTVFIKEQGGWAFVAENKEALKGLPPDPAALIGDLPKSYNVAAKLMVQNIPEKLKRTGLDEIKLGIERFLDSPAARQGRIDRDQARQMTSVYVANIEKLANEADELYLGFGVSEAAKNLVVDIGFSAKEGSSLASSMAMQVDAKTNFAGFALPEAAITMNLSSKAAPEDIAQTAAAIKAARAQWSKHVDDAPEIPADKREAIKAIIGPLFGMIEKTIATGQLDGGAVVVLLPKSLSFAAGGAVADGAEVEKVLKSLGDVGKDIASFPKLELNYGSLGDLKLSRLTAPIPDRNREAREILGDQLEIVVGIGPKTVIVAGGKEAEGLLKKVLDGSTQQPNKAVSPFNLSIALLPILKFSQSVDQNPIVTELITALERSKSDRIVIANRPGARSNITRIEIQEGVVQAIGDAAKRIMARQNRGAQ